MSLLHRNGNRANRRAARDRFAALRVEAATPTTHCAGEIVNITRDDGTIDTVRIIAVWTAAASCIRMLTVSHHPHGISSFKVRADSVVTDDTSGGAR